MADFGPFEGNGLIYQFGPYKVGIWVRPVPDAGPTAAQCVIGHEVSPSVWQVDDQFGFFPDIGAWQAEADANGGQGAWWVHHLPQINSKLATLYHFNPHPDLVQNTDTVTIDRGNALLPQYFEVYSNGSGTLSMRFKTT